MKYSLSLLITFGIVFSSCSKAKKESSETNVSIKSPPGPLIKEGEYIINTDSSIVKWTGREITTKIHYGTLNLKKGIINVNDRGSFSGKVIVDMNTINVQDLSGRGKNALEGHLRSNDFFSVESYPEATISFDSSSNFSSVNESIGILTR